MNDGTSSDSVTATVERVATEFGILPLLPGLESVKRLSREDAVIQVGFWGRFKAGKSRTLNSLAHTDGLLPVGVLPVTAVPTVLRHGAKPAACVEFLNGTSALCEWEDLADFITESGNPNNKRGVRRVVVSLPGVRPGLEWVDTPGTGSAFAHNTALAEEEIPSATAAILAVSVDHPFSEDDAELLRNLCASTPAVAVVLTKSDRLNDRELREVIDFTRTHAHRAAGRDVPVFPLSALPPEADARISTWREHFEREWVDAYVSQRGLAVQSIAQHKRASLAAACRNWLSLRLAAEEKRTSDEQKVVLLMNELRAALPLFRKQLNLLVRDFEANLPERLLNALRVRQSDIQSALVSELSATWPAWQMNLWRLTRTFEEWLRGQLAKEISALADRERSAMTQPLRELAREMEQTLRQFWRAAAERVEQVLEVRLPSPEVAVRMPEPDSPRLHTGAIFATHWDLLWFLIPVRPFRGVLLRHFRRASRWEVEKQVSRLAFAWRDRLVETARASAAVQVSQLERQHEAVVALLSSRHSKSDALKAALAELDRAFDHSNDSSPVEGQCEADAAAC